MPISPYVERLRAVFGGPECVVRYPNGDEAQYVIVAFACTAAGGALRPDLEETTAAHYCAEAEAAALPLSPWLRAVLPSAYGRRGSAVFDPPRWAPPAT